MCLCLTLKSFPQVVVAGAIGRRRRSFASSRKRYLAGLAPLKEFGIDVNISYRSNVALRGRIHALYNLDTAL